MFNITDSPLGNKTRSIAFGAAAAAFVLLPRAAHADGLCKDKPAPVYGIGGSATKPLLGKVGAALAAQTSPRTLVYQAPGACVGINAILGGTPLTGTASYWDTAGKEQSCTIEAPGVTADFVNMGNSATTCPGVTALPADVGDFTGPVNAYTLIAPKASSETSISREAAYFAFGFGDQSQAAPWTDKNYLFVRDQNSAAQIFISLATGVPAQKFIGIDTKTNAGTVSAVASAKLPNAALGLVSGEVADANRDTVKVLAYQHTGQRCGFWPDSSATAFDKRSVRNGQYWIWNPIHFFTKVDAQKKIVSPAVAELIGLFTGEVTLPNVDMLSIETKSGNVPKCAMNVWRDSDNGDIYKKAPDQPCGCAFEKLATGASTCTACETNAQCGASAPTCRFGFCEAK